MPDYAAPVALGIKVPDAMQSLGAVMGAANSMQSLKRQQFDLGKLEETRAADIAKNAAESSTAQTGATSAAADLAEKQAIREFAKSTNGFAKYAKPDGSLDYNSLVPDVYKIAPTQGAALIKSLYDAHTTAIGAKNAWLGFNNNVRETAAGALTAAAGAGPEKGRQILDQLSEQIPETKPFVAGALHMASPAKGDPQAWQQAMTQYAQSAQKVGTTLEQQNPNLVGVNTGGQTALMNPGQKPGATGFGGPASIVQGSVLTQTPAPQLTQTPGGPGVYQPTRNAVEPVGGLAPEAAAPTFAGKPLQYPVRAAGQPYTPGPSEPQDRESGLNYRDTLIKTQQALPTAKRNNEELIGQIDKMMGPNFTTSGIIGTAKRNVMNWAGDPEYKQLSKDLANAQISALKASGGSMDTDAGKALIKHATGDETYSPPVLRDIAMRASADITNSDMQATAAQKFAQKFGDNNMNAFKQEWNKNADTRVFQAMNIYNSAKDKAAVKPALDKLFGNDPAKRKEYFQKYQNIQKLYNEGSL